MPQEHVLHVSDFKGPLEERVVIEINLAHRKVVRGSPVGIHLPQ
jgi:hypothetical protein